MLRSSIAFFLVSLALGACSGGSQCTAGMSIACVCPGGATGGQVCQMNGTYATCVCGAGMGDGGGQDVVADVPVGTDVPIGTDVPATTDVPTGTDVPPPTDTSTCTVPNTMCGTTCTSTMTDAANCGSCGHACPAGSTCASGVCNAGGCSAPDMVCGSVCTDVRYDSANCGTCGTYCSPGVFCYLGSCTGTHVYSTYAASTVTAPFVNACTLTPHDEFLSAAATGALQPIALPFTFTFYEIHVVHVQVAAVGAMFADQDAHGFSLGGSFYAGANPSVCGDEHGMYALAPYALCGANLTLRTPGACSAVVGTAPSRSFVVTWNNATANHDAVTHLTFSAVLHEGTDIVDFQYDTMTGMASDGALTQVGVWHDDSFPLDTTQYMACVAGSIMSGLTVRFTPGP